MNDARDEHPSITTARHMINIADLWPELETRLAKQTTTGDEVKISTQPKSKPPIDLHAVDVMARIQDWVAYLGRQLLDETDWKAPDDYSTPNLLRDIAKWRVGHFTSDDYDEGAKEAFIHDAEDMHTLALKTARPSGARKIPLHVQCLDHATSDQGERTPCPGEYHALLLPWRADVPDMVCSEDPTHTMTPLEWQRAQRRLGQSEWRTAS